MMSTAKKRTEALSIDDGERDISLAVHLRGRGEATANRAHLANPPA